ncbi:hypothetical protein GIB67_020302 [Kingdonia uniflora]|uniref:Major facilitator superfamily (MFS) profile domain-containing protein n=1 Tax=Kingdonia uniflora TaxID=39325 RepID=A0A7J7LVD3_9MAGN|nr:hypothetical protein GIB67_020302 [Kingdonia uniflora]
MVEGGVIHKAGKTKLFDCFHLSRSNPYIFAACIICWNWRATLWLCHRVISRALLYIRDEFQKVDRSTPLQEIIVSMAVAGVIVGSAIGGWMNDSWGRRISILIVDVLFAINAIVMGISSSPGFIILERVFVGLGVGMASMTVPLYISEASPVKIRGALVSLNGLLITGEQFITYLVNLAFAHKSRTLRWMLGVAGVPAVIQFILMMFLPESPRWLYRKHVFLTSFLFFQDRKEEAATILKKLYPPHEVEAEVEALRLSVEAKIVKEGSIGAGNIFTKIKNAWSNTVVHRGLTAGIGCQVAQQFVGINTVMYYSPTIVQLAGYASNSVALSLSLITSGLNAFGSIVSMLFVDRYGRRKLLLVSMVGIIICLFMLTVLALITPMHPMSKLGLHHAWLSLMIVASALILMTIGICRGMAAVANWVSNLIVSQTFLSLTEALGPGYTFMLFGFMSSGALVYMYMFVPETKGLAFEEVEKKLARTWKAWENHPDDEDSTFGKAVP